VGFTFWNKALLVRSPEVKTLTLPAYAITKVGTQVMSLGKFQANNEFVLAVGQMILEKGFEVSSDAADDEQQLSDGNGSLPEFRSRRCCHHLACRLVSLNPAEPRKRPEHPGPMTGAFAPYCNNERCRFRKLDMRESEFSEATACAGLTSSYKVQVGRLPVSRTRIRVSYLGKSRRVGLDASLGRRTARSNCQ
jgi:hypothetical protein